MTIILALLLSLIALLAVAYPILVQSGRRRTESVPAFETLEELLAQRDAAFQALRDLTFDHRVGKITDEDFVTFETHLKETAAEALRKIDQWEGQVDQELDLALAHEPAGAQVAVADTACACPQCGRAAAATDRFCTACGKALAGDPSETASAALACPHCGRPVTPEDRFCRACGQVVTRVAAPA